ncbi:hypothetical protein O181_063522 [Austropuccinia psidii MF-1]|uniref:Reverse transcriptase Ty1/copia-type domain-containing protein n=1 Tax=Austropuccinia psidii MF-1 TaxID=1389203 RepID=A0A9Q3EPS7_9BASI|nr:hypothetical protein [Austropuccinia psidii MF-1]
MLLPEAEEGNLWSQTGTAGLEIALEFDIKDIGPADLMLGIKINQFNKVITLDQQHFAESLVHLYGMADCKPVDTPLIPNTHLQPAMLEDIAKFNSLNINFTSAIGSINYLSTATRPDLSFAVSSLSQSLEKPSFTDWQSFLHLLRYLKGSQHIGLSYAKNMAKGIVAYSNANWGNCLVTWRLVTGHLTIFHGFLVLWKTRKQRLVSLSTAEAEYKALCDLTSELLSLRQWCREANIFDFVDPITVFDDNQSCIKTETGNRNLNHRRMKHIDIQLHFVKEAIDACYICLKYVLTIQMLADFLKKSVPQPKLVGSLVPLGVLRLRVRGDVDYLLKNQDKTLVKRKDVTNTPATEPAHNSAV